MRRGLVVVLACCAYCFVWTGAARAEVGLKPGTERLSLFAGGILTGFDTKLRIDNATLGRGTDFNLRDLGVSRRQSGVLAGVEWRFQRRQRLGVSYFRFTPNATSTLARPIEIGGVVYPAGATVSTSISMEVLPITYSLSFIKRERSELAGTIGAFWNRVSFEARGESGPSFTADTSAKEDFPLPLVGLRYDHHISRRWSIGFGASGFALNVTGAGFDASGTLWNARAQAEYRLSKHFSVVGAVDAFELDVDANNHEWAGAIDYSYIGPQFYFRARF